jgi:hypothetical protein
MMKGPSRQQALDAALVPQLRKRDTRVHRLPKVSSNAHPYIGVVDEENVYTLGFYSNEGLLEERKVPSYV